MKKNLVMGTGRGYSWYIFEPFVISFLRNVPNADLVLFVDEISDFTRNYLKSIGGGRIKLEPFQKNLKKSDIINNRWEMFLNYAESHGSEYEQIFVADTRDVIFQDDVFKYFSDKSNFIGYATEDDTIGGAKTGIDINYQWLKTCFGKDIADKLANRNIICCGTVIGTTEEMKIFLRAMVDHNPKITWFGNDQATGQYVIYENLLPIKNIIEIDCHTGAILTTYIFHVRNPLKLNGHLILRGDGGVPAVIHQYDRKPDVLIPLVNHVYREKNFYSNYNPKDTRNALEQIPHLVRSGNFEMAMRFFSNYILGNTDFKDQSPMLIDTWGYLLENNTPYDIFKEMIEISLQHAIKAALSKNFLLLQLNRLLPHLIFALKNNHTISNEFKIFIANGLIDFAYMFFQKGNFNASKSYLDVILMLNIPLEQNFYAFRSQVLKKLG